MIYSNITGIILAGGKSTRMGENKSLLNLNGKTVIERVVSLMKSIFQEVIISTNTPEEYNFLNIPLYKDIYEYKGPLAGIHSGLSNSKTEKSFVVSCDIPLITREMIEFIINYKTDNPITICKADGFLQQLAGSYSKSVLPNIEKLLTAPQNEQKGQKKTNSKSAVLSLLETIPTEIINAEELSIYRANMFFNMNRAEDYEKIKVIMNI